MSVGFGFSVGDFIAALELVATVVDALRESGEASKRYRELVRQLDTLETVLVRVKRLELDESQHAEYVALQQAASQCQRTIDEFWKRIKKYQPALGLTGTTSRLKEGWMRIRWAVCKKEDINAFKDDVAAHTESIQLLLTTIQMSRATMAEKRTDRRNLSLASQIQTAYFGCMKKISEVFDVTSTGIEQGKQLLSTTSKILQMNIQIFQVVLNIQNFITRIPAQVDRQQPVYLVDALGRQSPFHLEFIRSAEALTAVLQANFSKTGQARRKIGRGEFVIQNSLTKRDINIFDDWEKCFYPGQHVEMSVIFQRRWQTGSSCPGCGVICEGSTEADVKCPSCDMTFRRIITIEEHLEEKSAENHSHQTSLEPVLDREEPLAARKDDITLSSTEDTSKIVPISRQQQSQQTSLRRKRKREYARDGELELDLHLENIRRVRIQTVSRGYTKKFRAMFGYFEEGGKLEPAFCWGFRTKDDESCLIIDFEDGESSALCDTIGHQAFKLGGLFHTELVEVESISEDTKEMSTQITWMEDDEVQLYLRFRSTGDRDVIWEFIGSAQSVWNMRAGRPVRTISSASTKMNLSGQSGNRKLRPSDLKRQEKIQSHPWKCPIESCKYHEYGWPTEKEMDRHHKDKHPADPTFYECLFKPCPYRSKRESNCKQHMEKAHGWEYVRSKNNGRNRAKSDSLTPQTMYLQNPSSDANAFSTSDKDDFDFEMQTGYDASAVYDQQTQLNFPEYNQISDMDIFAPYDQQNQMVLESDLSMFQNDTESLVPGMSDQHQTRPQEDDFLANGYPLSQNQDFLAPIADENSYLEVWQPLFPEVSGPAERPGPAPVPTEEDQKVERQRSRSITYESKPILSRRSVEKERQDQHSDGWLLFDNYSTLQDESAFSGPDHHGDPGYPLFTNIAPASSNAPDPEQNLPTYSPSNPSTMSATDTVEQMRARNKAAARLSRKRKMKQFKAQEEQITKLERERDHLKAISLSSKQYEIGLDGAVAVAVSTTDNTEAILDDLQPFEKDNRDIGHDHRKPGYRGLL